MSLMLAIALQLLAVPHATADDAFAARVARGKSVETGLTGPVYQKALWKAINDPTTVALKNCLARNAPADKSPFTIVADVQADGRTSQVAARPATPVANCLAGWLATMTLPPPPKLAHSNAYPIEIDVSITP